MNMTIPAFSNVPAETRVLVVDDDITARLLAQKFLGEEGFSVVLAEDGRRALDIFQETRPNLVLMDVEMPGLNGFEACRELRRLPLGKTVPILMVTGCDDVQSIAGAYKAGATDFVAKPINWLILAHRLRYMLRADAAAQALRNSETRLANAQRIAQLGNWEWDLQSNNVYWSGQLYRMLGLTADVVTPNLKTYLDMTHPEDREAVSTWFRQVLKASSPAPISHRLVLTGSAERVVQQQVEVRFNSSGQAVYMSGTVQDVTQLRKAEEKIRHLAYFDSLTGLVNRRFFKEQLQQILESARTSQKLAAVLFIDLDNFKRINDTLGHVVGDLLLKNTADRLLSSVRGSDCLMHNDVLDKTRQVARLGGDEFTLLLSGIHQINDAAVVAQRIIKILAEPMTLAGHEVVITPSIGIAVFPHDGVDVDTLLQNSDTAMYHAKKAGRNGYQFFTESMNVAAMRRLQLENGLRSALAQGELVLHYQPQVDLWSGHVVGVEALLRWNSKELGMIGPDEFIPLAEETGLIIPIGEWVIRQACRQAKAWHDMGLSKLRIAVNLSARQFAQKDLPEKVAEILAETQLYPDSLELEITESLLIDDVLGAIKTLHTLKSLGVRLAIDDFGTGYSSLSYLKQFPIDRLKIDRSFVKNITSDPDDASVALSIVELAHNLKLSVTAEGVETMAQRTFLQNRRCDEMQGFYFSPALPCEGLVDLLKRQPVPEPSSCDENKLHVLVLVDEQSGLSVSIEKTLRQQGYPVLMTSTIQEAFDLLACRRVAVVITDEVIGNVKGIEFFKQIRGLYPDIFRVLLSSQYDTETLIKAINEGSIFKFMTKPVSDEVLNAVLREVFLLIEAGRDRQDDRQPMTVTLNVPEQLKSVTTV